MKILMAASEAAPYAKTGGLADVIGALRSFSPSRHAVAERVAALKAAADQACDDRGQR